MDEVVVEAKADPKRPYKTYAAIVSAFLSSFLVTNSSDMPAWAVGLLTAAVAGLAVYITGNPIRVKKSRTVVVPDRPADPLY